MPVRIEDVAAHAVVSVATVSNVLNRPENVAEQTRDRVNASIRQLGFVRNESACQLRAGRSVAGCWQRTGFEIYRNYVDSFGRHHSATGVLSMPLFS
jgi:DNA-binding LacI/PurR family transcriptional regulator